MVGQKRITKFLILCHNLFFHDPAGTRLIYFPNVLFSVTTPAPFLFFTTLALAGYLLQRLILCPNALCFIPTSYVFPRRTILYPNCQFA